MIRFVLLVFAFVFCHGCSNPEKKAELHFNNGLAYDDNGLLFTGVSVNYNDDGALSSKNTYVKGIRSGKWHVYGYSGEIIQYGEYIDKSELGIKELYTINCERVEINKWYEGNNPYIDIYIINPKEKLNMDSLVKVFSINRPELISIYDRYFTSTK